MKCVRGSSETAGEEGRAEREKLGVEGCSGCKGTAALQKNPPPSFILKLRNWRLYIHTHPCGICVYIKETVYTLSRTIVYMIELLLFL